MQASDNKHIKHTKLSKPMGGKFHRLEFGFVGAPCSIIQKLCQQIRSRLAADYSFGFVDADHNASDELDDNFDSIYTDKINYHRFDTKQVSYFGARELLADHDAVLVNGNHFNANLQIVIINEKKKESLRRKLERLTNVELIILDDEITQPFDFITEHIEGQYIPIISKRHLPAMSNFIANRIKSSVPTLKGLVFAGGKSQRMGQDKSEIQYHDKPQYVHLTNLLDRHVEKVYLSVKNDEFSTITQPSIQDTFGSLGPFGGLLSAFQQIPNSAFITLPCDAPFIDEELLGQLIDHRNTKKVATCFHNPDTSFPEPLITIWEPRAYPVLLQFLSMGYSCPRKVLINSDIEELTIGDPGKLFNANTQEERDWALNKLSL